MRIILTVFLLVSVSLMAACQSLGYYAQSARGQFQVINQSKPIDNWLNRQDIDQQLKQKLNWIKQVRRFASDELDLPDNKSYTRYANIDRNYVVWNIFAAPQLSLKPYRWCYPVIGCQAYRGYFSKTTATEFTQNLKSQGFDVSMGGVKAYSTLGWFTDPILSTFINYSENDLAGLIFHELAHQVVYVKGDTVFNESFATVVENKGVEKWLSKNATHQQILQYRHKQLFESEVTRLILKHKKVLEELYASNLNVNAKLNQKQIVFAALKREYQALKDRNKIEKGAWDKWFARELNNANLIAIGAYYEKVDEFETIFLNENGDFKKFFKQVKETGET